MVIKVQKLVRFMNSQRNTLNWSLIVRRFMYVVAPIPHRIIHVLHNFVLWPEPPFISKYTKIVHWSDTSLSTLVTYLSVCICSCNDVYVNILTDRNMSRPLINYLPNALLIIIICSAGLNCSYSSDLTLCSYLCACVFHTSANTRCMVSLHEVNRNRFLHDMLK